MNIFSILNIYLNSSIIVLDNRVTCNSVGTINPDEILNSIPNIQFSWLNLKDYFQFILPFQLLNVSLFYFYFANIVANRFLRKSRIWFTFKIVLDLAGRRTAVILFSVPIIALFLRALVEPISTLYHTSWTGNRIPWQTFFAYIKLERATDTVCIRAQWIALCAIYFISDFAFTTAISRGANFASGIITN